MRLNFEDPRHYRLHLFPKALWCTSNMPMNEKVILKQNKRTTTT